MARILVVDDDQPVLSLVQGLLEKMKHEVAVFDSVIPAMEHLHSEAVDLIVSDINLPTINGFEFRDRLKEDPELHTVPFLFLTGADESFDSELSKRMNDEVVVFKPINLPSFRRLIESMLGDLPHDRGRIGPSRLAEIFEKIAAEGDSGVMTAYQGARAKKIVFKDGRLVFAIGNDPSEFVGQALVREGLVSEQGLTRLFEARGDRSVPLGEVFVAEIGGKVEDLQAVLRKKIHDAVLDMFIWAGGTFSVYYGGVESGEIPFTADIDLGEVVAEGMRRAKVWAKARKIMPSDDAHFEFVGDGVPDRELRQQGDKLLRHLIMDGLTVGQIKLELRGQLYAVGVKIAKWLRHNYIRAAGGSPRRPTPSQVYKETVNAQVSSTSVEDAEEFDELSGEISIPAEAPSDVAVAPILAKGLVHLSEGELEEARVAMLQVLELDPSNPLARKRLAEIEAKLKTDAQGLGLNAFRQVMLIGELPEDMDVEPSEAFVYSRLAAEPMTIEALLQVCPLSEAEIFRVLMRFVAHRIIKVV